MTPDERLFDDSTYRVLDPPRNIYLGNESIIKAVGIGTACFASKTPNGMRALTIRKTLHVPDLALTLISVPQIAKRGLRVSFKDNKCTIRDKSGDVACVATRKHGLYHVDCQPIGTDERAL
ncbi:hypothetical protein GGG16DRAFT_33937, partial [Schizophyllum commune]